MESHPQDDLIRTVALASFSYEFEGVDEQVANRATVARQKAGGVESGRAVGDPGQVRNDLTDHGRTVRRN